MHELDSDDVPEPIRPDVVELSDGTWIARHGGHVGTGDTRAVAVYDLLTKLDLADGPPLSEKLRDLSAQFNEGGKATLRLFGRQKGGG